MKNIKFFAQVGIFLALVFQPAANAKTDQHPQLDQYPNYVVIGAFSIHNNAIKFTKFANKFHLQAKFEMNANRQLYYVYVLSTPDKQKAIEEARRIRSETKFSDTWVYNGLLGVADNTSRGIDINPVTEKKIEHVEVDQPVAADKKIEELNVSDDSQVSVSNPSLPANDQQAETTEPEKIADNKQETVAKNNTEKNTAALNEVEGKSFFFKLYRATDNESVTGEVDIIDADRSRKVGSYKGNIQVRVPTPANKTGDISIVCEIFGYRKVQKTLNYNSLAGDDVAQDENGNTVVPFELVRLQKGDIAVMYNVYFFKDAGVMRPESRYEVNSLLDMLKENPAYKIRIHGHTNGGAHGRILSMGDSQNFFALTDTKEGFGSAKKLSEERAKVIRDYLVSAGIDEKRMNIRAWGGKRPIHDKHHTRAAENVRVEIEILED